MLYLAENIKNQNWLVTESFHSLSVAANLTIGIYQ